MKPGIVTTGRGGNQHVRGLQWLMEQTPGLTERHIYYWCTAGLFGEHNREPGSGMRRYFTEEDAAVARALVLASQLGAELGGGVAGASMETLHQIAHAVREWPEDRVVQLTLCDGRATVSIDLGGEA